MNIDWGEAEVDNHFRRVNILTITFSGMYFLFIIPKLLSGKKPYVNSAGEKFRQNCSNLPPDSIRMRINAAHVIVEIIAG